MIDFLVSLGLASGVARGALPYAATSAAHVLGIALLIGPILLVDLRLIGWLKGLDLPALALLRRTAALGLLLAMLAGLLLLSAKPAEYLATRSSSPSSASWLSRFSTRSPSNGVCAAKGSPSPWRAGALLVSPRLQAGSPFWRWGAGSPLASEAAPGAAGH